MFKPPRCPRSDCPAHNIETLRNADFYVRKGFYKPKCRPRPVPRFECRTCGCGFSRQTFRQDYCDKKPHLNAKLFDLLASGIGLRQSGRLLHLSRRATELKARKMSRHLGHLDHNLIDQFPNGCKFQMDEMETFETERRTCPVTLPLMIEHETMFVVAAESAPIRASGKMTKSRIAAIKRLEKAKGRRPHLSTACVKRVLRRTRRFTKRLDHIQLRTDEKTTYPCLARWAFGARLLHRRFSSKLRRDKSNPLFRINLTNAMARDLSGRLRRRSWLVSKEREFLDLQMQVFMAFRNFIRPRYNRDVKTPAERLKFIAKPMTPFDALGWRQDWGWFSIHPLSRRASSIREVRRRERASGEASYQILDVRLVE